MQTTSVTRLVFTFGRPWLWDMLPRVEALGASARKREPFAGGSMGVAWVGLLPVLAGAALGVADLARPAPLGAMAPSAFAASAPQQAPGSFGALDGEGGAGLISALTRASLHGAEDGVTIDAELGQAVLVQEEVVRRFALASLAADPLLTRPAFALSAGVSTWLEGVVPRVVGGYLAAVGASTVGASWSARLCHLPIWRASGGADPLRGLRVQDLNELDPGLAGTDLRLSGTLGSSSGGKAGLEVGATAYTDGNRRILAHAGAQLPVIVHRSARFDLTPAAYAETFAGSTRGFLTPHSFASIGAGVRVASTFGPVALDAAVEPHLFRYPNLAGLGFSGSVRGAIELGGSVIRLSTEVLRHGPQAYVQLQFGAERLRSRSRTTRT